MADIVVQLSGLWKSHCSEEWTQDQFELQWRKSLPMKVRSLSLKKMHHPQCRLNVLPLSQCQEVMHHHPEGDQCAYATVLHSAHKSGTKQDQVFPSQFQEPSMVPLTCYVSTLTAPPKTLCHEHVGHEGPSGGSVAPEHAYQCLV